ncbi:MAG TPA: N-acetylmuramic acid 6-phosphate etherase [Terriglobales bacterium]|nr:N-acetylmuramic acid 6-phosphate etherase [Terriglobales bacterium]
MKRAERRKTGEPGLRRLTTERANLAAADLDLKPALEIARTMNAEDAKVASAVKTALPRIATAIDRITEALRNGGRLIYVGAGTSGRIAALDAVECPPTFNVPPRTVQFVMSGGRKALGFATEANEDFARLGERDIAKTKPGRKDVVVGISASGRTPFTVAALKYARAHGAQTIAVTCNQNSALEKVADLAIVTKVGPEVIAGSTRLKAGTAQKMVLNMLTTGAMIRLGHVYGNLMAGLRLKNTKLLERGIGILQRAAGVDRTRARRMLKASGNHVPTALVMLGADVGRAQAERALQATSGHVRKAIALAARSN